MSKKGGGGKFNKMFKITNKSIIYCQKIPSILIIKNYLQLHACSAYETVIKEKDYRIQRSTFTSQFIRQILFVKLINQ